MELRSQHHVSGMPEQGLQRGRHQRRSGEVGKPVASRRVGPARFGHRQRTGHSEPDPVLAEVWIIRIVEEPDRKRLDELTVDDRSRHVALGGQLVERPGDAGGAPVQTARAPFAATVCVGRVTRPQPVCRVELPLRARSNAGDRRACGRFVETPVAKRLVTVRGEQHALIVGRSEAVL